MDFSKRVIAPPSSTNELHKASQKPKQGQPALKSVNPTRTDEVAVGYEKETNKLVTLRDLYEGAKVKSESSGVMFTPLITKQLKRKFDAAYAQYKENRGEIAEVEADYIKELLKGKCVEFFEDLRAKVRQCNDSVNERIKSSASLHELEQIMEKHKDIFTEQTGEGFDHHKEKFDEKIKRFRFAGIVSKKPFYDELITKIDQTREYMGEVFENIKDLESRIIQVRDESNDILQMRVAELIEDTLMIDVSSQEAVSLRPEKEVEILDIDDRAVQQMIGDQQLEASNLSLFGNLGAVWTNGSEVHNEKQTVYRQVSTNLTRINTETRQHELVRQGDLYYQRLVTIPGTKDSLLVGGAKDFESNQVSGQVILIRENGESLQKKSLIVPRSKVALAIGRTSDHLSTKNHLFAVGGQESEKYVSKQVERYHFRADTWQQLPSLVEGRADSSALVLGDSLYVFGGVGLTITGELFPLKTIERLSLKSAFNQKDGFTFTSLEVKLPFGAASIGILPLSQTETLLLGGISEKGEQSDQKLKFSVSPSQCYSQNECALEVLPSRLERADFFQSVIKSTSDNQKVIVFGVYFAHEIDLGSSDFAVRSTTI